MPDDAVVIQLGFTEQEFDLLEEARCCLTVEGFAKKAALAAAQRLIETSTEEERRSGVIPKFA